MDRRITVLCERSQQQKTNTSVDLDVGRGRDKYLKRRLVLELSSGQRSVTEKGDGETAVSRDLDSKDSAGEASEEGVSVVFQQDRGSRRSDHWTHANCCHYRCSLSRLSGIRQKSPPASPFFSSCPTGRLALMRSERENSGFHCIPVGTFRIPCHSSALPTPQGGQREQAAREGDLGPQAHIGRAQGPAHLPAGAKERGVPGGPPAPCQFHRLRCVQEAQLPAPGRGWQVLRSGSHEENGAAELLPQPLLVGPRRPKTQGHAGVGGGPHCETPMAPSRSLFPERWDGHLGRRVKIRAWEIDKLLESIFCILPVVEAFSLQKVGEMLEEVGAGWREVR
nr:uncharacterized protein LOC105861111 isoform X4 [Microcebus murinus]